MESRLSTFNLKLLEMTEKKAKEGFNKKMFDYFGAFINKNLVGFILLTKKDKIYWIKHILVDKKLRNKKIGKKLLIKAIKIAKKYNLFLKTEVLKENKIALNFFIKNNFKIEKYDKKEKQFVLKFDKKRLNV